MGSKYALLGELLPQYKDRCLIKIDSKSRPLLMHHYLWE